MKGDKKNLKGIFSITLVILFFLIVSYLSQTFIEQMSMAEGPVFAFIYFLLVILEIILGFVTVIPLVPLALGLWGFVVTFILTWLGWVVGSAIIFYISRKFGVRFVKKFYSLERIHKYEEMLSEKGSFFSIVVIRLLLPIDALSYAVSIFSKVKFSTYILATAVGYAPWVFSLAYFGSISFEKQLVIFFGGLVLILLVYLIYTLNKFLLNSRK